MLVHVICRPLVHISHMPRSGVRGMAEAVRDAGLSVIEDAWASPSSDMASAISASALELRERWAEQEPDVVHTFGLVATMAAVKAGSRAPIVATFDEVPCNARIELELAQQVAAVLPLSRGERDRWRARGVPTLSSGVFPVPVPVPDIDACARVDGDVVTLSADGSLDALVSSMPMWAPARLVIGARLSASRLAGLRRVAEGLGVSDRIDYRPGLRGQERAAMWQRASVLVAGVDGSRHGGHVLEAAAHGIPCVAVAQDAHLDHVVAGTTGILVDADVDARGLGHAVTEVIGDSFDVRAMGISALLRVRTLHAPALAGQRLGAMYDEVPRPARNVVLNITREACVDCTDSCVRCIAASPPDHDGRNALAIEHLPLARQLAQWYAGRGQSTDDLVQVAYLGLVRAAERFDPSYGKEFHSFAIPTIVGELRRHFRDHAWAVRVPRTLQETALQVQRTSEELQQTLGHEVTSAELAAVLGLVEEEVRLAQRANGEARSSHSLDYPIGDSDCVADLVGEPDPELEFAELRNDVRGLLQRLPEREQQILLLRFYGERTQSEIAERLGMSQVHVSRVLARTLAAMRDHVLYDVPLPTSWEQPEPLVPSPTSPT